MKVHSSRFQAIVEKAKEHVKEISIAEVKEALSKDARPFCLIDVREESEWAMGHIPTAIHLGKGVIERDIEKVIPNAETPLVMYCGGGYRSALAAESLQKMGYSNVLSMAGGYGAWKQQASH